MSWAKTKARRRSRHGGSVRLSLLVSAHILRRRQISRRSGRRGSTGRALIAEPVKGREVVMEPGEG